MVNKPSGQTIENQFQKIFNKPITKYAAFQRATESQAEQSKKMYRVNMAAFCLYIHENPDQIIANRREHLKTEDDDRDHYERQVKNYKKFLEQKRYAGRTVSSQIGRIQGFFTNNSKRYSLDLGRMTYSKARKNKKYSPEQDECKEIYGFCESSRDRLIFALMYQNGLAPVDVANIDYKQIPLESFQHYEGARSKTGIIYYSVTTPEIVTELTAYLKIRGKPAPDEPLFKSREGYLNAEGISQMMTNLIEKAGFGGVVGFKPTSLRDAFEDALVDAKVGNKTKEAMMGHTTDIEHQYGSQKNVERRLIAAMKKVYPTISLTQKQNSDEDSLDNLPPEYKRMLRKLLEREMKKNL
jgi:integrase